MSEIHSINSDPLDRGRGVWRGFEPTPAAPSGESFPVLVVGAGPVGLTLALDLARRGHPVIVLDKRDFIASGTRAFCYTKRTLDIWDRLGVGAAMLARGVPSTTGTVLWGDRPTPVFEFDFRALKDQRNPAFIHLPQYHVEDVLVQALEKLPQVEIRWAHELRDAELCDEGMLVHVATPTGDYSAFTSWLVACDGVDSSVRRALQLAWEAPVVEDALLIADVNIESRRAADQSIWFDPPFSAGKVALLHKQPGSGWRFEFQLGTSAWRDLHARNCSVDTLIRGFLGADVQFERTWYGTYIFRCRRLSRFVHDRVLFAGDAAHEISPYGARGCNSGIADADNLGWKLHLVLVGEAPSSLIETYNDEAVLMAEENMLQSARAADFLAPEQAMHHILRNSMLELACEFDFARPFVNFGRPSSAALVSHSPLNTPDEPETVWARVPPGSPAPDAPIRDRWLLGSLGNEFVLLTNGWTPTLKERYRVVNLAPLGEAGRVARRRYDLLPGSAALIRPDQYVCARWRRPDSQALQGALQRARGFA